MAKRVYELAKEMGVDNTSLIQFLTKKEPTIWILDGKGSSDSIGKSRCRELAKRHGFAGI